MKIILTCTCFNMKKKASEAFSVIYPNEELPEIVRGRDMIYKIALVTDNKHIMAISKLKGRFAYYLDVDGPNILEEYNLLTGRRIA